MLDQHFEDHQQAPLQLASMINGSTWTGAGISCILFLADMARKRDVMRVRLNLFAPIVCPKLNPKP